MTELRGVASRFVRFIPLKFGAAATTERAGPIGAAGTVVRRRRGSEVRLQELARFCRDLHEHRLCDALVATTDGQDGADLTPPELRALRTVLEDLQDKIVRSPEPDLELAWEVATAIRGVEARLDEATAARRRPRV